MVSSLQKTALFFLYFCCSTALTVMAQSDSTNQNSLHISGSTDWYYMANKNQSTMVTSPALDYNSISLGWVSLAAEQQLGKASLVADFAFGPRANNFFGDEEKIFSNFRRLYIAYAPVEELEFSIGSFQTFVGYEYDMPGRNYNYSNSWIYSITPASYTGAMVKYFPAEGFDCMVGVFNDPDTRADETPGKHLSAQINYERGISYNSFTIFSGKDYTDQRSTLVNWWGDLKFTDRFSLGFDLIGQFYKFEDKRTNKWLGSALYTDFAITEPLHLGLRAEYVTGWDGYIITEENNNLTNLTATLKYTTGNLRIMPEVRLNGAKRAFYPNKSGIMTRNDAVVLLGLAYVFGVED